MEWKRRRGEPVKRRRDGDEEERRLMGVERKGGY